jgi:hypothetical protein
MLTLVAREDELMISQGGEVVNLAVADKWIGGGGSV